MDVFELCTVLSNQLGLFRMVSHAIQLSVMNSLESTDVCLTFVIKSE